MPSRLVRTAQLSLMTLLLAGCVSGPDYKPPAARVSASFLNAPAPNGPLGTTDTAALAASRAVSLADFWRGFADPVLDSLVQAAVLANLDLRTAQTRLSEARALLLGTQAQSLPSVAVEANATRSLAPGYLQPGASRSQRTGTVYTPAALMNWELDLFGRNARAAESAAALVSAHELGVGAAQAVVVAAVARDYLNLRGLQQRLVVAEESLLNLREALRVTEARWAAGRSTPFDVARARNLVASTAATLPALQAQAARAMHRIATLGGQPAAQVAQALAQRAPLPGLPFTDLARLPVGTPELLLRRRPDIQVAERQLAAATADVGVAVADRFPRISLSGLLGLSSNRAGDLASSGAGIFTLGASLSWAAWDFGRTQSRVDAAQARSDRSLLQYEQTVLTALEETENALNGFTHSVQQATALEAASRSAQEAAEIARKRFAAGTIDLLPVLDAERQVLAARDRWMQAQADTATALVDVYRALGGGWTAAVQRP
jgi:outer membrane protein, multidrug efflux system